MKFRRRPTPLLLLLLPYLASSIAAAVEDDETPAKNSRIAVEVTTPTVLDVAGSRGRPDVGTRDAPVDGKDGKPHAGPFVGIDKDAKVDPKKGKPKSSKGEDGPGDSEELVLADGTKLPNVNDGVMDDPNRTPPRKGTTGTEGGVSEKEKARKAKEYQTGEKVEKKLGSPKEAPDLPPSQQIKTEKEKESKSSKLKDVESQDEDDAEGLAGLEKPTDLPDKTDTKPPLPKSANKNHLDISKPVDRPVYTKPGEEEGLELNDGLIQPLHSFVLSLTMILVSEIGDKTFLIAALMAMKHPRLLVFSSAFSALIAMTILSAVLGHAVPTLIPKRFTNFLASALFLIFGGRMLKEGLAMSPNEGVAAEMQEVEMELEEKEKVARQQGRRRSSISPYALELGLAGGPARKSRSGSRLPDLPRSPSSSPDRSPSPSRSTIKHTVGGLTNLLSLLLSPAWVQTFAMTFLGEWGDRSQIATIAMAAGQDYWWVTGGAVSGHAVCTGVAVIGGRAIAGRVSLRVGKFSKYTMMTLRNVLMVE